MVLLEIGRLGEVDPMDKANDHLGQLGWSLDEDEMVSLGNREEGGGFKSAAQAAISSAKVMLSCSPVTNSVGASSLTGAVLGFRSVIRLRSASKRDCCISA